MGKKTLLGAAVIAVLVIGVILIGIGSRTTGEKTEVMAEMPSNDIITTCDDTVECPEIEEIVEKSTNNALTNGVAPSGKELQDYLEVTTEGTGDIKGSVTGESKSEYKNTKESAFEKEMTNEIEKAKEESKKVEEISEGITVITETKPAPNTEEKKSDVKIDTSNSNEAKSDGPETKKNNTSEPSDVIDFGSLGF